jgi:hypothetical protein
MHQINLLDETLDKNQAHHYNLAIQYGLNGLSFCLFDTIKNKFIAFRHYSEATSNPESLSGILESDDLLKLSYREKKVMYTSGKNTLVPLSFFDESKLELLYNFNLGEDKCSSLHFNKLVEASAFNIFSYPQISHAKLKKALTRFGIYHRTSPFIENLVVDSGRWHDSKAHVYIHKGILDIGVARMKKLEFFNTFEYKEYSDIAYFILNVMEQLNLSPNITEVYVSVDLDNHGEIFDFLGNYLQHIKFIRPSENYTYSYVFDEVQLTRFANLFNLGLCVS